MNALDSFEEKIGYKFKDKKLLRRALTHSSYANENKLGALEDNERLEFLGDAVLEIVVSEFLFNHYNNKNEGSLSKLRASLVCEPTLAKSAKEIGFADVVLLSYGEEHNGGRKRNSILSDAYEAVIGAMYLDGGIEPPTKFIIKNLLTDIEQKQAFYDSKTRLQEIVQGSHRGKIRYNIIKEEGPDHAKVFTVEVVVGSKPLGVGSGSSKKSAEQEAAYKALLKLE